MYGGAHLARTRSFEQYTRSNKLDFIASSSETKPICPGCASAEREAAVRRPLHG